MKVLLCISIMALFILDLKTRVINFRGGIKLKNDNSNPLKNILHPDFRSMLERRLNDQNKIIPEKSFEIKRKEEYKKTKFMKVVSSILKEAKKRNLKIKSIKLGSKIRSIFDNKNISKDLITMVNDPQFFQKYKKELEAEKKHKKRKLIVNKFLKKSKKRWFNKSINAR